MAKKIIVLRDEVEVPGLRDIDFCFWFAVPSGEEYPQPGRTSSFKGASAAEITALQDGAVIEAVVRSRLPAAYSPAEFKAFAIALYDARESAFTTTQAAIGYPGKSYGTYYDGSSWTAG